MAAEYKDMKSYCNENKKLFNDVLKSYDKASHSKNIDGDLYEILNYKKIFSEMIDMIKGCKAHYDAQDDKYNGDQILNATRKLYNGMLETNDYRTRFILSDTSNVMRDVLEGGKELSALIEDEYERSSKYYRELLVMTKNQFKRVQRVFSDDMEIVRWLNVEDMKKNGLKVPTFTRTIQSSLLNDFRDKRTPVIHVKDKDS